MKTGVVLFPGWQSKSRMPSKFIIYGLVDPRDGQLRYVGKSTSGLRRPRSHTAPSNVEKIGHTHLGRWLRKVKPEIEVLEVHETAEALPEAERHFIAYFRFIGCRLVNATAGGEGSCGFRMSDATRRKMSDAKKGRVPMWATMAAASARRGTHHDEAARLKMATSNRRRRSVVDENGVSYRSMTLAAETLGLDVGAVSQSVRHGCRAGGHHFHLENQDAALS